MAVQLERFEHRRNDERLRDGLTLTDSQRAVFIRLFTTRDRDKQFTRDVTHRFQNARIRNPAFPELLLDHGMTLLFPGR